MGSPGEPPTGRIYPDCTCAWKVPDVRCPWHGTPTPAAPADDIYADTFRNPRRIRYTGCGGVLENGKVYDVRYWRRGRPTVENPDGCSPVGDVMEWEPADDAGGAEAMCRAHGQGQESAMRDAAAWLTAHGMPHLGAALLAEFGCAPLPAPRESASEEAVVEAARALCDAIGDTMPNNAWGWNLVNKRDNLRAALAEAARPAPVAPSRGGEAVAWGVADCDGKIVDADVYRDRCEAWVGSTSPGAPFRVVALVPKEAP